MKILFSHSYFLNFDAKQLKAGNAFPPLGTLYAASLLRNNGYNVALFDSMLAKDPEEILPKLIDFNPDVLVIYDDGFNYLTKMCLTKMREAAFQMASFAHSRGIKVIVNSSDASDNYDKYLKKNVNYIIRGEGEMALLKLLNAIEQEQSFSLLPNLIYTDYKGLTQINPKNEVMKDLDALPMPAWDLVDIESYRNLSMKMRGYFSLNMATTRGCPYKCNWCAKPIYGNRYNSRSPQNVVDELQLLIQNYKVEHIWFADDIFGLKPGWLEEFAGIIKERNIRIKYKIQSRADLLADEKSVNALAESGCNEVWLGAESGSQKILDAMDKGISLMQIAQSRALLKKYNISTAFFLQFGYVGESEADIKETIEMVKKLKPDDIGISVSYPLPGTKFYESVKTQLKDKTNWIDSDDLDTIYKSTYSRVYYKNLQRYVHYVYRTEKDKLNATRSLKSLIKVPFHIGSMQYFALKMYASKWKS